MTTSSFWGPSLSLIVLLSVACDEHVTEDADENAAEPSALEAPARETPENPEPQENAISPQGVSVAEAPPPPEASEACARVVVVAWRGAAGAAETITRTKDEAEARAEELLETVRGVVRDGVRSGASIEGVARHASDAPSSASRGGLLGTYSRDEWPSEHEAIVDPLFATHIGSTTDVVETGYGFVFARRCEVEKVHTRHILMRFEGTRDAGDDVNRTRDEARGAMLVIRQALYSDEADFEALARQHSEDDASAERGGDLGAVGRGCLAPAYEEAAFTLLPGRTSDLIETEFGFHLIQRVE